MLRGCSALCSGDHKVLGVEVGLAACKENTFTPVPFLFNLMKDKALGRYVLKVTHTNMYHTCMHTHMVTLGIIRMFLMNWTRVPIIVYGTKKWLLEKNNAGPCQSLGGKRNKLI